jgi:spore germination cell wall hydrolase CwlJ-like protein
MVNVKSFKLYLFPVLFVLGMTFTHDNSGVRANTRSLDTYLVVGKPVNKKELDCLAKNIFFEARGEVYSGQVAVARVVMNRIHHGFGDNTCQVVYQTDRKGNGTLCQFSWVCEKPKRLDKNDPAYIRAQDIAYRVLAFNAYSDRVDKNVLFFHSKHVNPRWRYKRFKQIGNHIFYAKI